MNAWIAMELVDLAMGITSGLCVLLLVYGAWLCIQESFRDAEPERRKVKDEEPIEETVQEKRFSQTS